MASQLRNRKNNRNRNKNQNQNNTSSSSDNKKQSKLEINSSSISSYNAWPSTFIALITLLIIAYNELQFNIPSITGSISSKKPYRTVEDFYPYYLSEHKHPDDQRLHIFGI